MTLRPEVESAILEEVIALAKFVKEVLLEIPSCSPPEL